MLCPKVKINIPDLWVRYNVKHVAVPPTDHQGQRGWLTEHKYIMFECVVEQQAL